MLLDVVKLQYKEYSDDKFIETRIEKLFPKCNFYCYKKKDRNNAFEWAQIEQLVVDSLNSPSLYIKKGLFEPQHSTIKERDILSQGIENTLADSDQEISHSLAVFKEKTSMPSKVMLKQKEKIEELRQKFLFIAFEKPWVL